MGNVVGGLGQPPAVQAPLILEETASDLERYLRRQVRASKLRRIVERRGSAGEVAGLLGSNGGGTDVGGFAALHIAVALGWLDLVDRLLESPSAADRANALTAEGYTPLMLAACTGCAPLVEKLLAKGADIHRRSRRGATAVHFAAQTPRNLAALRALLGHPSCTPALVNRLGYRQRSALLLALMAHGDVGIVQGLLHAGANPSERTPAMANISLLHSCAHLGRVDAMRALIEAGAQVDSTAADGITVLQECFVQPPSRHRSEAAKRQMFKMLVDAGANLNAVVPHKNYTVLHFAMASCKDEATCNLIADSGLDLSISINKPVLLGDASAKNSLLHLAAMRGWTSMAERLVAAGADMGQRNKDGMQPLHVAILNSHADTVEALLRLGADPLGTCPDCYPSYTRWKRLRGLQVMQALMGEGNGQGALPAFMQLIHGNPLADNAPQLTAVDLACCVARDIPCVEVFVEAGVLPSHQALALAEQAVPIMRALVERPLWTPQLHAGLPPRFKIAAQEFVKCLSRPVETEDGRIITLPPDAVAAVLQKAAFPVSQWASGGWLTTQSVREPPPREHIPAPQPAAAANGAGGPADMPDLDAPGGDMPPFMQAVMQQVQEQLGLPAGQAHIFVMPPPGGMAGGGGGAGAGPGAPPPGLQMVQHHQVNEGGQQVHVMEFAMNLPFGGFGIPGAPNPEAAGAGAAAAAAGAGAGGAALPPGLLPGVLPVPPPAAFVNFINGLFGGIGEEGEPMFDLDDLEEPFIGGFGGFAGFGEEEDDDDGEEEEEEGGEAEPMDGEPPAEPGPLPFVLAQGPFHPYQPHQAQPQQQPGPAPSAGTQQAAHASGGAGPSDSASRKREQGEDAAAHPSGSQHPSSGSISERSKRPSTGSEGIQRPSSGCELGKRPSSGSERYNLRSHKRKKED